VENLLFTFDRLTIFLPRAESSDFKLCLELLLGRDGLLTGLFKVWFLLPIYNFGLLFLEGGLGG